MNWNERSRGLAGDIERQREAIEELRILVAPAKLIREAELIMLGLVHHLAMLRERRHAIPHNQRRPRDAATHSRSRS